MKNTNISESSPYSEYKFCSNCGEKLFDDAKFCKFCGKKIDKHYPLTEIQPDNTENSKVQCVMVIQDVYWPHDSFHVSIGDLFVTPDTLILIELAVYEQMGGFETFMAGMVGGVIGAVIQGSASSQSDKAKLLNAQAQVIMIREADYAMSPEERLKRHPNATVITRGDILSLETSQRQGGLKIKYSKGELNLALKHTDKLRSWYSGSIELEPNTQGMNLGLPSIDSLLISLESGKELSGVSLHDLSSNKDYLTKFWIQFGRINSTRQDAIVKTIIKDKNDFWESAREYFQKLGEATHFKIGYSIIMAFSLTSMSAVIVFLSSLFFTDFWTHPSSNEDFIESSKLPVIIFSIVFVLSLIGFITDHFYKCKKIKEKLLLFS